MYELWYVWIVIMYDQTLSPLKTFKIRRVRGFPDAFFHKLFQNGPFLRI